MRSPMVILMLFFAAFSGVLRTEDVQAQGYHVEGNRIVVEGEDWDAWTQPKGVLERDEAGGLRPHFVHAPINACLNAADFGAEHKGGSNVEAIPNVMDGDPSTFWEPADVGSIQQCWFQIDLGRCVTATKIVLRFVEEGRGDPFLHFKVEISNGWRGDTRNDPLSFKKLWGTTEPNEDQRHFEFQLSLPFRGSLERLPGDAVRYVRVRMLATRGDRREEVSADAYAALSPEDQGAVDYFCVTAAGEEALVTPGEYAILPPEEKGSVRYYRRERPRLAEVEVWSLGENLMLGLVDRGGEVASPNVAQRRYAVDGDYSTRSIMMKRLGSPVPFLLVDLGASFWVDTMRLASGLAQDQPFAYRVQISDWTPDVGGESGWTTVTPEAEWEDARDSGAYTVFAITDWAYAIPTSVHQHVFPPHKARFLKLSCRFGFHEGADRFIWEWQIFGEGYIPGIVLTSGLIEVDPSHLVAAVDWEADIPPGTRIEVQTRTGDRLEEVKLYFNSDGEEVTEYWWHSKLPRFLRGPVKIGYVPGPGWSPWSRVVEYAGARFESLAPRRYMLARVRLVSDDPHQCAVLRSLSFPLVEVLMKQATGRLLPDEVQRAGVPEVFSLRLHPVFRSFDPGFDQVLIKTSPGVKMELVAVDIAQGGRIVALTDSVTVHSTSEDSLWVEFPTVVRFGGPEEITIRFQSAIYQHGTLFDVFLKHHAFPNSWQQAESETFHPFLSTFVVGIPTTDRGLTNVEITPRSFSPNGDGIHDELTIRFTLVSVRGPKRPVVTIYDLRGRRVRRLSVYREEAAGAYTLIWDGRDDEGVRVPPGVYLVRVEVHTEDLSANQRSSLQPVHVIY